MRFEEAWYILNLIGFRKLPMNRELVSIPGEFEMYGNQRWPRERIVILRKHRESRELVRSYEAVFCDRYGYKLSAKWYSNKRDPKLKPAGPEVCARCGRTEKLEKDHILALSQGGKDKKEVLPTVLHHCRFIDIRL